jgi:hypothetical protein
MKTTINIPPNGSQGKKSLRIEHDDLGVFAPGKSGFNPGAYMNWDDDELSITILDGKSDDSALQVNLNKEGGITAIFMREGLSELTKPLTEAHIALQEALRCAEDGRAFPAFKLEKLRKAVGSYGQ